MLMFKTIFGIPYRDDFPTQFYFYKIIPSRSSLSSSLFGLKFENMFISVSLKIDTFLWTLLSLISTSQLTDSKNFLMPSVFFYRSPKPSAQMEVDIQ